MASSIATSWRKTRPSQTHSVRLGSRFVSCAFAVPPCWTQNARRRVVWRSGPVAVVPSQLSLSLGKE